MEWVLAGLALLLLLSGAGGGGGGGTRAGAVGTVPGGVGWGVVLGRTGGVGRAPVVSSTVAHSLGLPSVAPTGPSLRPVPVAVGGTGVIANPLGLTSDQVSKLKYGAIGGEYPLATTDDNTAIVNPRWAARLRDLPDPNPSPSPGPIAVGKAQVAWIAAEPVRTGPGGEPSPAWQVWHFAWKARYLGRGPDQVTQAIQGFLNGAGLDVLGSLVGASADTPEDVLAQQGAWDYLDSIGYTAGAHTYRSDYLTL